MTIMQMCLSKGWGGLEMYPVRVSRYLQANGCRVLVSAIPDTAAGFALAKLGLPFFPMTPSITNLFSIFQLQQVLKGEHVDIIHCHKSSDLRTAAPAAWMAGTSLVFTEHMGARRRKGNPWHRWAYGQAARIFWINEEVRRRNVHALPVTAERIFTLHYGVDLEQYHPVLDEEARRNLRKGLDIPLDASIVTLPGRLSRPKGQIEFIEAAALSTEELPNACFLIVGGLKPEEGADSGYSEDLHRLVAGRGLTDRVKFTGFRTDIPQIMELSNVVCVPSWDEAFGLVVIEAMALGVPVIATRAGGIPELVEDGHDGRLVPPKDPQALASAIIELAKDPLLAQRMGHNGNEKVIRRFSLTNHVRQLIEHYRSLSDRIVR